MATATSSSTKVALITGAGSGIGRAVAIALSAEGYRLALAGRRPAALEETAALLGGDAGAVLCVAADISDKAQVDHLFAETQKRYGRLDLLFNNAGIGVTSPIEDLQEEDWLRVVNTNLNGSFWCLQAAFRLMKEQRPMGGRIINNGSISADRPRPHTIAYTATKHAVTGLTKSASLDGRPYDIACGQIDIGNAATALGHKVSQGALQADGTVRSEPVMDVADVGAAVVYMDSLPLSANVQFMTVMATRMPYIGRG